MRRTNLLPAGRGRDATARRENPAARLICIPSPLEISMNTQDIGQQIADMRALVVRTNPPEVMTPCEAAQFLGVTTETLFRWRKDMWGPKYAQPNSRIVRYLRSDLVAWLEECRA